MKRRGFLGFLGGAVAAGPSMAKQAVAEVASLSIPNGLPTLPDFGFEKSVGYPVSDSGEWEVLGLAELVGLTREQHAERMRGGRVHMLDPDIQSWRSISLSAKIQIQRERTYWRDYHNRKTFLERAVAASVGKR